MNNWVPSWVPACFCNSCNDTNTNIEIASVLASTGEADEFYMPAETYQFEDGPRKAEIGAVFRPSIGEASSPALSRSSSQNAFSRPTAREFEVQLDIRSRKIGMDMVAARDRKAMIIAVVKTGAVQDYNSSAADGGEGAPIVKRGDRIVEANGCGRRDPAQIVKALKKTSGTLSLTLVRLLEFKVANLNNVPRGVCGFKFAEGPKGQLMITGFDAAANKSLQPDVELREGDYILKVNGKAGTAIELKSEIDASDVVSLRVQRGDADSP